MKTEQELVKNNRLIAEFMGYEVVLYQHSEYRPIYNGNVYAKTSEELENIWNGLELHFTGRFVEGVRYPFHVDFNCLVPVIRKIEESGYVVCIAGIKYQVYRLMEENNPIISLVCGDLSKKTELTYNLIIAFIEWFNLESKTIEP